MNSLTWLLIFIYLFCTVIDSHASEHQGKRYGKVLLIPLLEGMLFLNQKKEILLSLALLFCWGGDLFLIHKSPKRNMTGMLCFLCGHVLYTFLFGRRIPKISMPFLLAGIVIYGCFMTFYFRKIWCHATGKLKVSSMIYMLTIFLMSFLSFLSIPSDGISGEISWDGTFLFLISDTLISDQLFRHLPQKGVMETYGPAQLLIVIGFLLH